MVILGFLVLGQLARLELDNAEEGQPEDHVGDVAHYVVEVGKHVERPSTAI